MPVLVGAPATGHWMTAARSSVDPSATSAHQSVRTWTSRRSPTGPASINFVAVHSGRCVDVKDNSAADGYDVVQYDCNGGLNPQWRLKATVSGYVQLIAEHGGKCLDVADASDTPGAYAQQYHRTTGTHQQWLIENQGNGSYHLKSGHSQLCPDVMNGSPANGASLIRWTCSTNAANQQWQQRTLP